MTSTDPFDALSDPVVKAAVDQAMEPYRALVTPEMFEEMRESLADFLVMHPVTSRLIRTLRPEQRLRSGEERVGPAPEDAAEETGRKVG